MYTRSINPVFETIGKRRKMIGVRAQLFDGSTVVLDHDFSTYSQAETALDEYVRDLLIDGMHRTATELDGGRAE